MAPTYLNTRTNVIDDLPENIGRHPVLGRDLVLVDDSAPEPEAEVEEVIDLDADLPPKTERKVSRKFSDHAFTPEQEG